MNNDYDPARHAPWPGAFGSTSLPANGRNPMPAWMTAALLFLCILLPESVTLHFLGVITPVWVTNAVGVAFLLRNKPQAWPGLILTQIAADTTASMSDGNGFAFGIAGGICDAIEILAVSAALHSIEGKGDFFTSFGRICKFAAVSIIVPVFSATGGATLLHATYGWGFEESWRNWYLSCAFGLLIVTPFLLLWTEAGRISEVSRWGRVEIILLTLLVGAAGYLDFNVRALTGMFISFPFLLLAAFRGGLLGATTASVMLIVVASWLTMTGHGEIAGQHGMSAQEQVLLLQFYFAVVLLSSLPVAVMLEQRKLLSQFRTLAELSRMARHDFLTNLPNRLLFQEHLAWMQAEARRNGGHTALLLLDLDRFKPINDLHGHAAGDNLLMMVADRLRITVRESDTVARLGGDEFAILSNVEDPAMARNLAQRVIAALSRPFSFMDITAQIGCSIGIALDPSGPADAGILVQQADAEILVQQADTALYKVKAEGRNGFRFFEPGMDEAARRRATMEIELRQAIHLGQIEPTYQPIVAMGDARIVGFEMLAHWNHPALGEIPPSVFVQSAESLGLVGVLSEQLTRKACMAAMTWPGDIFVTVNVSPLQLRDRSLPGLMRGILADTGLSPLRFEIELTESALITDFNLAHEILLDLKSTGIRLTLDDFGTGYSSLLHLQTLPLDKIKIDKGFVGTMHNVLASRKIVAGVIGLGHSLGLPIVAEGIEDAQAAAALHVLGCDLGQGWFYGRAVTAAAAAAMLSLPTGNAPVLS